VDVQAWLAARRHADRALDERELSEIAAGLAARPSLWAGCVRHDPGSRHYLRLHRDQHLDAWLICWCAEQETGLHDHDLSSGAVHVVDGELVEERLLFGAGLISSRYGPGQSFSFGPTRIHDVRHAGGPPATSLHLYSPPLWRMGMYEPDESGALCRRPASYLDEFEAA
jgi:hypothetical protein